MGKLFNRIQEVHTIDANSKAVDHACDLLWESMKGKMDKDQFDKDLIPLFEKKYQCKVIMDNYGVHGKVHFKKPALKTHFLLKYGS